MSLDRPVLVDTDVLVYWTAFACQKMRYSYKGIEFDDHKALREYLAKSDLKPKDVEFEKRLELLPEDRLPVVCANVLEMIREECGNNLELFLSGDTNFRTKVATLKVYKGNRVAEKPVRFEAAREYWEARACKISDNQEADDDIAIRQAELGYQGIIATIDKDLNMIPGRHFNWQKEKGYGRKYIVKPKDAERWFWLQMLTGDTADNIPGISRCGPKTAEKLVDELLDPRDWREAVTGKYKKQYGDGWRKAMNEVGQLLWMRRREGELWTIDSHEELIKL